LTAALITVAGAGVLGLWQALTLARGGHRVRLLEASKEPFENAASRLAGALLGPDCEAEAAPPLVRDLGRESVALWRAVYPGLVAAGTLAVAGARDRADFARFARLTQHRERIEGARLAALEPNLAGRFGEALYFPDEAHMAAPDALAFLLAETERAGAGIRFGQGWESGGGDELVVDCRGMAARADLPDLRGVRGERLLVRSAEARFSRPIRLLHPRHPIYVVPWGDGRFVIGATVIESEDGGPATVRSALELLGSAYALDPAFGEAEILDMGAGIRPAFPDNIPRAVVRDGGRRILVNGAYRHGFLLAPVLAQAVAGFLGEGASDHPLLRFDYSAS